MGAVKELLTDRVHGLFFEAGNAADLAEKIEWASAHPQEMAAMRHSARERYLAEFTPARNYQRMMEILETAIAHKRLVLRNASPGTFRLSPPEP
jgi:glycosyltransferase involved in cell wall biosynthesis